MPLINKLVERLKRHPKRVAFPEGSDPRILQAARKFTLHNLGVPILVGDRATIKSNAEKLDVNMSHIRIVEPRRSSERDNLINKLRELHHFKRMDDEEIVEYLDDPNYFSTLMLATSQVDAIVSGASSTASSALRPLLQIMPMNSRVTSVSSLNILDLQNPEDGKDREIFLSDCAIIPNPSSQQLCDIAINTAALSFHLTNRKPRVALLSYTSKSTSSNDKTVAKMKVATELAREKATELGIPMEIDGELEVDAALDPIVAHSKNIESNVAGQANVLIFPDLHSANIASKLLQTLTHARTYGPIITGLTKPAAEISRSATASDIFGTAVMVASQAVSHKLLYPTDGDDLNEDVTLIE